MNDFITIFKHDLIKIIRSLEEQNIIKSFNAENLNIDYLSNSRKGDISTNLLILLKKQLLQIEFDIKNEIENGIKKLIYIQKVEIAKAGFINIFFKKEFLLEKISELLKLGNDYGNNNIGKSKKINIEYVSANPTGPIHVAHMRGAVLGDVLASILNVCGFHVVKEYYVNNAGSQIEILGNSLFKRYQQINKIEVKLNEDEYPGSYLVDIAELIFKEDNKKWLSEEKNIRKKYFENYAVSKLIVSIKKDLSLININFDKFSYESEIVEKNYIDKVFTILKKKNLLYDGVLEKPLGDSDDSWEKRNQLLFRSSAFGDDSDRAFKKANGDWTYFANDSAYHYEKISRNFDSLINIWGADHIGYISRMKAVVEALSDSMNYLDVQVCQIVRLIKNNMPIKMSKRSGNFIALSEMVGEVGKDPLRFFMVSSKCETPMDFDMNKVVEKNRENPVFYCQYAYARASSVINKSGFTNSEIIAKKISIEHLSELEWKIILKILSWPYLLQQVALTRQPHRITNYLQDLSSDFHSIWNMGKDNKSLRFIDLDDIDKTNTKIVWIESLRVVLKKAFEIIGIDHPETM